MNTNHSSDGGRPGKACSGADARGVLDADDSGDEVKEHESELSDTSGIEMMEIDDEEDNLQPSAS